MTVIAHSCSVGKMMCNLSLLKFWVPTKSSMLQTDVPNGPFQGLATSDWPIDFIPHMASCILTNISTL